MPRKKSLMNRLLGKDRTNVINNISNISYLRSVVSGSFYRVSDLRGNTDLDDIKILIDTMRALAKDSQVSTSLSYYATDATTPNTSGDIIWATSDEGPREVADIINALFKKWNVNNYARDHILELATIGNLYMPTTDLYRVNVDELRTGDNIALDFNGIPEEDFDIVPSSILLPEDTIHLWYQGKGCGYVWQPDEDVTMGQSKLIRYPESSIIHFSLGGLLGKYSIDAQGADGDILTYDIQFASPLMESAVQPTQILTLLEDAVVLSSLVKVVRFINVDCGDAEEEEIQSSLQMIKDAMQQQLSLNTSDGDTQSFLNPQSPNNLIFLPKIHGADAVSVTDLDMRDSSESDDKLLNYYQDKKLSVLGVPKEALNYSAAEGLGNAGAVMSQRSALYANSLQRIETGYMNGWRQAINTYFRRKGYSQFIDKFTLHMCPILTNMDAVQSEKRDAAVSQAQALIDLLKAIGVDSSDIFKTAISEALTTSFPETAAAVESGSVDILNTPEESL